MAILGLSHYMMQAKDLKKTLHFYNEVMGLPLLHMRGTRDDPQFLIFKNIEISQRKDTADCPKPETCSLQHIAFYVDKIEELVDQMEKKGAKFSVPIRVTETHKWTICQDPDGNKIELTTAPHCL